MAKSSVRGLYQRGQTWWLRYTVNGKQCRESLGTGVQEIAEMKALTIINSAPLEAVAEFETELETYLKEAQARGRLSSRFAPARRYVLKAFAQTYDVTRLSDITLRLVERWVGDLSGEVKPGTVESYLFHLRAFCTWLVKKNKLRENVAAKVELGKVERVVRKNFLTKAQVQKLIEDAPTDEMKFILYCGFHCGMRKLEVIEARPEWFRLGQSGRRGCVSIGKTATFSPKDRDERTIPLPSDFEAFLRDYGLPSPFMLRPDKKHAKHRYRYDFDRAFETYTKAQGVKCTFHDARRTFVSLKIIQDSSLIFKLAKWTGDDVKVLQKHYGHLLADDEDIEVGL